MSDALQEFNPNAAPVSPLGQQLLSRLVQPAGVIARQHLPVRRTQATAQSLIQRSHLPNQIQARYTAVGQIQPMMIPERSRVESLALGSTAQPELAVPDVGIALGLPTLEPGGPGLGPPTPGTSASDAGISTIQRFAASDPPLAMPTITRPGGMFRVSRQRNVEAESSHSGMEARSAQPLADLQGNERSPIFPHLLQPPATLVLRQTVNLPTLGPDGAESALGGVGQRLPSESLSVSPAIASAEAGPATSSPPEPVPRVSAKLASRAEPSTQSTLTVSVAPVFQRSQVLAPKVQISGSISPQPMTFAIVPSPGTSPQILARRDEQPALARVEGASPIPRVSHQFVPAHAEGAIAPLPLAWSVPPAGEAIARMPADAPPPVAMPATTGSTMQTTAAPEEATSPAPNIKQMAAQVSRLLQRQLTVERERRGLKSW